MGNLITPVAAIVTAPLLARGLGVDGRGQLAAAQSISLLAVSLAAVGLPDAVTHFVASRRLQSRKGRVYVAIIATVSGLVATLAISLLAHLLSGDDQVAAYLITIAGWSVVPSILLNLLRAEASGRQQWAAIAREKALGSGLRLVLLGALFVAGWMTPFWSMLVVVFSPLAGALSYLVRRTHTPVLAQTETPVKAVLGYGGRVWVGAISGILLMRVDQSLLIPLSGPTQLGLYAVAVSISELPLVINAAIRDVAFARHSEHFDAAELGQAARVSGLLSLVAAVAISVCLPLGLPLLFGEGFSEALGMCLVLLLAVAVGTPGSIAGSGLSSLGLPGYRSLSLTIACLANLGLLLVLAPLLGGLGAALATLVGNLLSSNLNIALLRRRVNLPWRSYYLPLKTDVEPLLDGLSRFVRRRH